MEQEGDREGKEKGQRDGVKESHLKRNTISGSIQGKVIWDFNIYYSFNFSVSLKLPQNKKI